MEELIKINGLALSNGGRILSEDVSFDVVAGDCVMLCGANGSGKTTLLRLLSEMGNEGEVVMVPTRIPKVRGFSLRDFVGLSSGRRTGLSVDEAIGRMGLDSFSGRDISELSDGEFQRAVVACGLVSGASVMLFDEPTAFLDIPGKLSVLRALRDVCDCGDAGRGTAVIFSTHDVHDGLLVATKVLSLGSDGIFRVLLPTDDPLPYLF